MIDRLASHNFSFAIHEIKTISTNRVDRIRGVLRTYEHSTNQEIVNRSKNLYDQNNSIKSVLAVKKKTNGKETETMVAYLYGSVSGPTFVVL